MQYIIYYFMKAMTTNDKSHAIAAQKAKKLTEKFHVLIFFP